MSPCLVSLVRGVLVLHVSLSCVVSAWCPGAACLLPCVETAVSAGFLPCVETAVSAGFLPCVETAVSAGFLPCVETAVSAGFLPCVLVLRVPCLVLRLPSILVLQVSGLV
jgi:hypothetical protein